MSQRVGADGSRECAPDDRLRVIACRGMTMVVMKGRAYAGRPPETKVREARSTVTISSGVLAPVPSLAG